MISVLFNLYKLVMTMNVLNVHYLQQSNTIYVIVM